jgi:hypothetical protein
MVMARSIGVEQLLIWAYRDECVGLGGGLSKGEPSEWANPVYGMDSLGTRVDGGGSSVTYPDDALTVDAAVSRLAPLARRLVRQHASNNTRPPVHREPIEIYPCDAWGKRTAKPRHMFAPMDAKKRHPIGCFIGWTGDSHVTLYRKWQEWIWWWEGLAAVDAALRTSKHRLKTWELADFDVPQHPWENDPDIPQWLWMRVILTQGKKLDTVGPTLRTVHRTGR